ncbi:5272_t:CDS:2, partial [Gigaspora rosea]
QQVIVSVVTLDLSTLKLHLLGFIAHHLGVDFGAVSGVLLHLVEFDAVCGVLPYEFADSKSVQSLWNNTNQGNRASSLSPQSSLSTLEKRKSVELIDSSNKRQRIDQQMGCLCLNIDVRTYSS